jgi:hypothetical protein
VRRSCRRRGWLRERGLGQRMYRDSEWLLRRRGGPQPRLGRSGPRVEIGEVRDQIPHLWLIWERLISTAPSFTSCIGFRAGQGILAVDIHGAGAADAFTAGAAEGQGRIDVVLDPDQAIITARLCPYQAVIGVPLSIVKSTAVQIVGREQPVVTVELTYGRRGTGLALVQTYVAPSPVWVA